MSSAAPQKHLKDQRRADLIVPYAEPEAKASENNVGETFSTALPMAAMFTRNRMVGWGAVIFSLQNWLNESPADLAAGKQPAYFAMAMAFMSLLITYMPVFFPTPDRATTGTGPAAPAPAAM
ncbi:hypothetical protein FN846DRAFT_625165 [Sphaerosporella brunnea]|uniref:Uncharacterized protein n=1 Tax=Sphaerosporella brunnea TaxID=1250544 RepID=A0A5J5F0Z2_9PEZI|nr:hypothetical protein FN846DRAFT_625165 [Sphaerosporella brunnea]